MWCRGRTHIVLERGLGFGALRAIIEDSGMSSYLSGYRMVTVPQSHSCIMLVFVNGVSHSRQCVGSITTAFIPVVLRWLRLVRNSGGPSATETDLGVSSGDL